VIELWHLHSLSEEAITKKLNLSRKLQKELDSDHTQEDKELTLDKLKPYGTRYLKKHQGIILLRLNKDAVFNFKTSTTYKWELTTIDLLEDVVDMLKTRHIQYRADVVLDSQFHKVTVRKFTDGESHIVVHRYSDGEEQVLKFVSEYYYSSFMSHFKSWRDVVHEYKSHFKEEITESDF